MKKHGRRRELSRLIWTKSKYIRQNMNKTLASSDPLFASVSRHTNFLTELRQVRNHIAHKSSSTAVEFRSAVRARYGALRRGMTPGLYLLQRGSSSLPKLEEYLVMARVLVKDVVRA
jgi:hypothetical protein